MRDSICRKRPEPEMLRAKGRLMAAKGMRWGLRVAVMRFLCEVMKMF